MPLHYLVEKACKLAVPLSLALIGEQRRSQQIFNIGAGLVVQNREIEITNS